MNGRGSAADSNRTGPLDGPTMVIGRSDSPTALIAAVRQPPPVFVDPSGRRRSRLRWLAYAAGLLGLTYTGLVGISFAGVVEPHTVLPFVDEVKQPERPAPPPKATVADPDPSTAVPHRPASTVAPTVVPTPRSVASTRPPSATRPPNATRPPSVNPAGPPASPGPRPTGSVAPTAPAPVPTQDPLSPPVTLPDQAGGLRVDG
ncbi:hypothetical protein ABZ780_16260 [Micromonospora sp. NPDC047467]|uniref:hypothetical protein n=1 Tax=Micromonospora sp. NPDC047467 TaxID=3154814 RepID=UPI0033E0C063